MHRAELGSMLSKTHRCAVMPSEGPSIYSDAVEEAISVQRTRIRCRAFLLALLIVACALTVGTYINARYNGFAVSLDKAAPTESSPGHI